jgi:hypothetical protein
MTFFIFNFLTIERNSSVTIIGYIYIFNLVIILFLIINIKYLKTNLIQINNKNNIFCFLLLSLTFHISILIRIFLPNL